jgi:multidrug resistance efflux pump
VAAMLLLAVGAWMQQVLQRPAAPTTLTVPTAQVQRGVLQKTLRIAGSVTARQSAAIRAPRLTGPDSRGPMTLMELAEPGSILKAGDIVAQFERRQGQDHVDDVKSTVVQRQSDVDKRRAELMIAEETTRQAVRTARGEAEKAQLDLRTAEVRSDIEAELLRLAVLETEANWKQLQEELELQQRANQAEMRGQKLDVAMEENHLNSHIADLEQMTITAPVPGLVVMETNFRNGQFNQVETGDQVYPQTLFMRVVDISEMVVSGVVNQADIQGIRIGQDSSVRLDAYPDLVLPGEVSAIGALASAGGGAGGRNSSRGGRQEWVRGVEIQITIQGQDERLIPDLSASADIILSEQPDQLLVPRSAIRERADGAPVVHVREGGQFRQREVEIGDRNATHAVVLAGLSENEVVALTHIPAGS